MGGGLGVGRVDEGGRGWKGGRVELSRMGRWGGGHEEGRN